MNGIPSNEITKSPFKKAEYNLPVNSKYRYETIDTLSTGP